MGKLRVISTKETVDGVALRFNRPIYLLEKEAKSEFWFITWNVFGQFISELLKARSIIKSYSEGKDIKERAAKFLKEFDYERKTDGDKA